MPSPRDIAGGFMIGAFVGGTGIAVADKPTVDVIAASVSADGTVALGFAARRDGEAAQVWSETAVCAPETISEVARLCGVVDGETDRSDNRQRPEAFRSIERRVIDRQPDGSFLVKDADEDARKAGIK